MKNLKWVSFAMALGLSAVSSIVVAETHSTVTSNQVVPTHRAQTSSHSTKTQSNHSSSVKKPQGRMSESVID